MRAFKRFSGKFVHFERVQWRCRKCGLQMWAADPWAENRSKCPRGGEHDWYDPSKL